ncbi:hypothetical protein N9D08_01475 [bacterium]|nr:hypothetical protein [bacterium]
MRAREVVGVRDPCGECGASERGPRIRAFDDRTRRACNIFGIQARGRTRWSLSVF